MALLSAAEPGLRLASCGIGRRGRRPWRLMSAVAGWGRRSRPAGTSPSDLQQRRREMSRSDSRSTPVFQRRAKRRVFGGAGHHGRPHAGDWLPGGPSPPAFWSVVRQFQKKQEIGAAVLGHQRWNPGKAFGLADHADTRVGEQPFQPLPEQTVAADQQGSRLRHRHWFCSPSPRLSGFCRRRRGRPGAACLRSAPSDSAPLRIAPPALVISDLSNPAPPRSHAFALTFRFFGGRGRLG